MPELVGGREVRDESVEDSGVALELSVGHLLEISDGCEELYVAVCYSVAAFSFALVHLFEFLSMVFEGFYVQDEFSSPDEPLIGLFPAHCLEMCPV